MQEMHGVIHLLLERPIKMRESFRTRTESHVFAEVVSAFGTVPTRAAHNPTLDRYAHPHFQSRPCIRTRRTWSRCRRPKSDDDAGSLMTQDQGCADLEVAVPAVEVVMEIGPTKTCCFNLNSCVPWWRRPQGTRTVHTDVKGAIEEGCRSAWERHR